MKPQILSIKPTYQKENGLWVKDLQLEGFNENSLVQIPSRQIGGNHAHPRIEAFIALSVRLELNWLDGNQKRTLLMKHNHDKVLTVYQIPAGLPHAVHNSSLNPAFLLEFASGPQHDVELVKII